MNRETINQKTRDLRSLEDLQVWATELAQGLRSKEVLLLQGPLGAGKTEFVKALVKAMGGDEIPMSPSFALHNTYPTPVGDVEHLDLYRLDSDEELESSGFWDLFEKEQGLIIVEWAEKLTYEHIPHYWPMSLIQIDLQEDSRQITLNQYS